MYFASQTVGSNFLVQCELLSECPHQGVVEVQHHTQPRNKPLHKVATTNVDNCYKLTQEKSNMNTEQSQQQSDLNADQINDDATKQYLTFILAGEEYGVDILRVQEIKCWDNATQIPNTPGYIKGVINLRGTIVPIVDLRTRFKLDSIEYNKTTVVIVLKVIDSEGDERTMGFVVDAVSEVYNLANDQFKPAPDFGSVVNTEFIKGLATVDEKMVILLNIDHLIDRMAAFGIAGIAESNRLQPFRGLHFQNSQIAARIARVYVGVTCDAARQTNVDFRRAFDDMVVRQNQSRSVDHDTTSE